jgi:hypothetical protein
LAWSATVFSLPDMKSMKPKLKPQKQDWFCVEDCSDPRRPTLLLSEGTLQDCHDFIEQCRLRLRPGVYRVNYSLAMRKYFASRRGAA